MKNYCKSALMIAAVIAAAPLSATPISAYNLKLAAADHNSASLRQVIIAPSNAQTTNLRDSLQVKIWDTSVGSIQLEFHDTAMTQSALVASTPRNSRAVITTQAMSKPAPRTAADSSAPSSTLPTIATAAPVSLMPLNSNLTSVSHSRPPSQLAGTGTNNVIVSEPTVLSLLLAGLLMLGLRRR